jgi:hypothetical protein
MVNSIKKYKWLKNSTIIQSFKPIDYKNKLTNAETN